MTLGFTSRVSSLDDVETLPQLEQRSALPGCGPCGAPGSREEDGAGLSPWRHADPPPPSSQHLVSRPLGTGISLGRFDGTSLSHSLGSDSLPRASVSAWQVSLMRGIAILFQVRAWEAEQQKLRLTRSRRHDPRHAASSIPSPEEDPEKGARRQVPGFGPWPRMTLRLGPRQCLVLKDRDNEGRLSPTSPHRPRHGGPAVERRFPHA